MQIIFESTDEDVAHRNLCRYVNTNHDFYLFTVSKEKSELPNLIKMKLISSNQIRKLLE